MTQDVISVKQTKVTKYNPHAIFACRILLLASGNAYVTDIVDVKSKSFPYESFENDWDTFQVEL